MTGTMPRLLIVTDEPIGPLMGETAIRAWELATVLAREFRTTLAAPAPTPPDGAGFFVAAIPPATEGYAALTEMVRAHDVIIAQRFPLAALPAEEMAEKYLVVDLARPWVLEGFAANHARHRRRGAIGSRVNWSRPMASSRRGISFSAHRSSSAPSGSARSPMRGG